VATLLAASLLLATHGKAIYPQRLEQRPSPAKTEVANLLQGEEARLLYNWLTRTMVEAVSFVRYIHRPASYVLLGAPDLAIATLAGPANALKELGQDAIFGLAENLLDHPKSLSRKVASWGYKQGLDAYRENYRLHHNYKDNPLAMSEEEAESFLLNWHVQGLMAIAKRLYNRNASYKGAGRRVSSAGVKEVQRSLARLSSQLSNQKLDKLLIWKRAYDVVAESTLGLPGYPPYREYVEETAALWQRYREHMEQVGLDLRNKPGKKHTRDDIELVLSRFCREFDNPSGWAVFGRKTPGWRGAIRKFLPCNMPVPALVCRTIEVGDVTRGERAVSVRFFAEVGVFEYHPACRTKWGPRKEGCVLLDSTMEGKIVDWEADRPGACGPGGNGVYEALDKSSKKGVALCKEIFDGPGGKAGRLSGISGSCLED